jgi:transposase
VIAHGANTGVCTGARDGAVTRVEVLVGPERRRRWSVEQKQEIVAAAFGPGAVVRDVARQADVAPSWIYR